VNFWAVINGVTRREYSHSNSHGLVIKLACLLLFGVWALGYAAASSAATVVMDPNTFDHMTTGFPLTGRHSDLECEDCHVGGVYESLPTLCRACHDDVLAPGMPGNHIATSLSCDACHSTQEFLMAARKEVDHSLFGAQPCVVCHNGYNADGKAANHLTTSDLCGACHGKRGWTQVSAVDHSQVYGSCFSCHNGVQATGKSATHMSTTDSCVDCHAADAGITWNTTQVDHSQVLGVCSGCHDGVTATGKGPTHIPTSKECNNCHTTVNWIAAADVDMKYFRSLSLPSALA